MCYSDPIFIDFFDFLTSYEFMKLKKKHSLFFILSIVAFHFLIPCSVSCLLKLFLSLKMFLYLSVQLKLMLDSVYICRFLKKKDVCRGLLIYYYINIPRLKCKLYHFRNCYSSAKQFTFK